MLLGSDRRANSALGRREKPYMTFLRCNLDSVEAQCPVDFFAVGWDVESLEFGVRVGLLSCLKPIPKPGPNGSGLTPSTGSFQNVEG